MATENSTKILKYTALLKYKVTKNQFYLLSKESNKYAKIKNILIYNSKQFTVTVL